MQMTQLVGHAVSGHALNGAEAEEIMEELLGGRLGTAEIVSLLSALNARSYRAEELAGFARVMRRHAMRVFADGETLPERMVDTCGTGGDDSGTFNISTAAAIVAAAAGARVAKHGNRAASSKCGSADVLDSRNWNWISICAGGAHRCQACHACAEAIGRADHF
jgi:anthranilate phosphoribosyltransferase